MPPLQEAINNGEMGLLGILQTCKAKSGEERHKGEEQAGRDRNDVVVETLDRCSGIIQHGDKTDPRTHLCEEGAGDLDRCPDRGRQIEGSGLRIETIRRHNQDGSDL